MYEIAFNTEIKAICDGGPVRFRQNESSADHIGDAVYLIGTLALGKADKYSHRQHLLTDPGRFVGGNPAHRASQRPPRFGQQYSFAGNTVECVP